MAKTMAESRFKGPIAAVFPTEAVKFLSQMWVPRQRQATEVVARPHADDIYMVLPLWQICPAGNGSLWKCVNDDTDCRVL